MSDFKQSCADIVAKVYGPWDKLSDTARYVTTTIIQFMAMIYVLIGTGIIGFWTFVLGTLMVASFLVRTMIRDGKLVTSKARLAAHTADVEAKHAAKTQDKDKSES